MFTLRKYCILVSFLVLGLMVFYANRLLLTGFDGVRLKSRDGLYKHTDKGELLRSSNSFCQSKSEVYHQEGYVDVNNTVWPWNSSVTLDCPNYHFNQYSLYRRKAQLDCSSGSPIFKYTMTNSPSDIQVVEPDNKCLLSYIHNCCLDKDMVVPNVMNYIWFADVEVGFFTLVSFISVIRFMRPCVILFHGPYIPKGTFWNFFISVYPNVILVNETMVHEVFGHKLKFKEHGSDVMRIHALKNYGGLYLDWDQILVKPVDPLRKYIFTMSLETPQGVGNQFIMAERNATFLTHWYNGYKNYTGVWAFNSIQYPFILSKRYPELIHVEPFTGLKPKQRGGRELWFTNSDWSQNYGLHLYLRGFRTKGRINMRTIRNENTTIGAVCRRVLFGRKEMCKQ